MIKVTNKISWIGIKDWDLRLFHGHELSTNRGSTYNSYVIQDEKTVLVDTVWPPHSDEYMKKLQDEIGLENIDYIIALHLEPDHGGLLGKIMELRPNIPIYCTAKGKEIIKAHFHKEWDYRVVKTGDTLNIGENTITFVEMKMIHWPDTMMIYLDKEKAALTSDAFGQHICTKSLFSDKADECEVKAEAIKYYANIVSPFSKIVKKKLEEIIAMNLDIQVIAPSHGVIFRENPMEIIELYQKWCDDYKEDFTVIIYDSMYNATKKIAQAIEEGLVEKGETVKLFNASVTDTSELITEIFKAKTVMIGSSTVNNGALAAIEVILHEIKGHKLNNKDFVAFGSYGWSGEAHKDIHEKLLKAKLTPICDPIALKYNPTDEQLKEIKDMFK